MDPQKVRITVLRNTFNQDFVDAYAEAYQGQPWRPCDLLQEGQTFVTSGWMPEGFCSHAWADILRYVMVLARDSLPDTFCQVRHHKVDGYR
jgi:uncharacterized repeat protein (TIGR04076 family)